MQLDHTRITIRERGIFELYDLALRVIQGHAGSIFGYWLVGAVPCALFNAWVLSDRWTQPTEEEGLAWGYLWHLALLMIWQYPLATAPLTLFLGKTMFLEQTTPGRVWRSLKERLWQLIWVHGVLRGAFLFGPIVAYVSHAEVPLVVLAGMFALAGVCFCYFFWPYFNEVLLLEGNPLLRKKGRASTLSRVSSLHSQSSGEVFSRSLLGLFVGGLLLISLCLAMIRLHGQAMLDTAASPEVVVFYCHLASWMLLGFFTVVRFLSYLDLRIRSEGWEIELLLKAEGARIARQLA